MRQFKVVCLTATMATARVLGPVMALVCAWLLSNAIGIAAEAPSARIDYKLPKSTTLGEPAILTVTLVNTTGYRITADFGIEDQTEFVFRHTKPDGSLVTATPALAPKSRQRSGRLMLRGNVRTVLVVLDEWLNLSQIGRHTIEMEFHGSIEIEGGTQAELKRRTRFLIDVKPRDAKRLEKRAGEWLKQVSTLSPGAETRAAAAALMAMTDPVVIPYLELATARTRVQVFADALTELSAPEARVSLERLARSPDPEVRTIAQRALARRRAGSLR